MCDGPSPNYVPPKPRFISPDALREKSRPNHTEFLNNEMCVAAAQGRVQMELPERVVTDYYWFLTKEELEQAGFKVLDELDDDGCGSIFVSWAPVKK
jgi:hypothetical protein